MFFFVSEIPLEVEETPLDVEETPLELDVGTGEL